MKKTKVLIPALGILALGMAASVTGTVAWFTSNPTVKGSQITVSVQETSDLRIAKGHDGLGGWVTEFNNWNISETLSPVSCIDATSNLQTTSKLMSSAGTYDIANSEQFVVPLGTNIIKENGEATTPISATGNNSAAYELSTQFVQAPYSLIYRGTEEHVTVYYKVIIKVDAQKDIDEAARIAIKSGSEFKVSTLGTYDSTNKRYTLTGDVELDNNSAVNYDLFAWYEGTDPKCINQYAVSNSLLISVAYSLQQSAINAL